MKISHIMSRLKILSNLCETKQKTKDCLQCFSSERVLVEHKETCLKINGKQTVKIISGSIKTKNYLKQLAVPFKIYADFESLLKRVWGSDKKIILHTLLNIKNTFVAVLHQSCIYWW